MIIDVAGNLIRDYEITLKRLCTYSFCKHFRPQKRKSKLFDLELTALALTAEYMSVNSELQLFIILKYSDLVAGMGRSLFNKRRRYLGAFMAITNELSQN